MSKPRNKAYRPRARTIPPIFNVLTVRDEQPELALQIYGAIYAFLDQPSAAASNNLCRVLCEIAKGLSLAYGNVDLVGIRDEHVTAVRSAILALEQFTLRYNKHGSLIVRDTEAMTIKAAAGKLDEALGIIPWHQFKLAQVEVAKNMAREKAKLEADYQARLRVYQEAQAA